MSNPRGLVYDANTPAFLQRLKGQTPAASSGGENSDARASRKVPTRLAMKDEDEDDGPTYVLEGTGEVVSSADYTAMIEGKMDPDRDKSATTTTGPAHQSIPSDQSEPRARANPNTTVAGLVGARGKRKVARVIGAEEDREKTSFGNDSARPLSAKPDSSTASLKKVKSGVRKKKSVSNRTGLSFNEDE